MENIEKNTILSIIKQNINFNGFFNERDLLKWKIKKEDLKTLLDNKTVNEINGWYYIENEFYDILFLLQQKFSYIVFSGNVSSNLLELTDIYFSTLFLLVPENVDLTELKIFLKNNPELKVIIQKQPDEFLINIKISFVNNFGSKIFITNKEKTLCDIVSYPNLFLSEVVYQTIYNYFLG